MCWIEVKKTVGDLDSALKHCDINVLQEEGCQRIRQCNFGSPRPAQDRSLDVLCSPTAVKSGWMILDLMLKVTMHALVMLGDFSSNVIITRPTVHASIYKKVTATIFLLPIFSERSGVYHSHSTVSHSSSDQNAASSSASPFLSRRATCP